MQIGIFGGTFNPVHYGHLRAAEEVREKLNLKKILFVPSKNPPLKSEEIAGTSHRYQMLKLALQGNRAFELSDIEFRLHGKSYTVRTMERLRKTFVGTDFFLLLGIDAFLDIPNWWHPEKLISITEFVIISRPGLKFADLKGSPYLNISKRILRNLDDAKTGQCIAKLISGKKAVLLRVTPFGISSTEIRRIIREGKSIKYLLPPTVKSYIISNKLYK